MNYLAQITYNGVAPKMFGGPLPAEYTLLQMHFHWGELNTEGSEHSNNGHLYKKLAGRNLSLLCDFLNSDALEAHFVHIKSEYGNIDVAKTHQDGIAVLGALFVVKICVFQALLQAKFDSIEKLLEFVILYLLVLIRRIL
jgi:Eukaryotic-type carbonic anhydrase